jgi:hypothetical protein
VQLNLAEIPRLAGVPLLGILPDIGGPAPLAYPLTEELIAPLFPFAKSCMPA